LSDGRKLVLDRLLPAVLGAIAIGGPPLVLATGAAAGRVRGTAARADAPRGSGPKSSPPARAPSGPPLLATTGPQGEASEASGPGSPAGEADPLVSNGLGSPTCRWSLAGELAATAKRNCETSGFVASGAPTGNYGIDVHIDTGLLGLSSGGLLSVVQDLLISPIWMAVVWIVHALVVMLEWCFTIDLLRGDSGLGAGLASAQRYLTSPWLPLALSVASVLLAYDGLVRRRVAESIGQALMVLGMICGGLWLMANPLGTVGALSDWANQAGLGTLAVAVRGTPAGAGEALGTAMDGVFAATVEGPWCYLEFGDVRWCRDPTELDPGLKRAGMKIAQEELTQAGAAGNPAAAVQHSARLLREARTNGALFLALPSNGPQRNSINDEGSLLRELCRTDEATNCSGPTAAQAEFRTGSGTWARLGGLLLIAVGVLGMLLLLGHIGLRLLMAAMLSLFYVLLTPGIVLAPALGERGRGLFRAWAGRLFGAVLAKLIFAFLLGVVLAVMTVLESLSALGWWTQWLLMAAFWWGVFFRRHQLLSSAAGFLPGVGQFARKPLRRRAEDIVERSLVRRLGESRTQPEERKRRSRASGGGPPAADRPSPAPRALASPARDQSSDPRGHSRRGRLDERRAQLSRITGAHGGALAAGNRRRAAMLEVRGRRVALEIQRDEREADDPRSSVGAPPNGPRRDVRDHGAFLDEQAGLPPRGARDRSGRRRDYPALAPLAELDGVEYEALPPGAQRAARLRIDRELAARRGAQEPESDVMRDIREVAAGRKRQLGIGRP